MKVVQKLQEEIIGHLDLDGYAVCGPQEPVVEALKKMRLQHVSAVLVEEDGRLVGIFTERDALTKVTDQPATWTQPVAELMTRDPQTLDAQQPISSALRLMNAGDYRNVPIVDEHGRIKGNLPQQRSHPFSHRPVSRRHLQPAARPRAHSPHPRGSLSMPAERKFENHWTATDPSSRKSSTSRK